MPLSRFVSTLLGAALLAFAVPATAHHVPTDDRVAHHVVEDQRLAEGDLAAKLVGSYLVEPDADALKQLEEARKSVEAAGESEKEMAEVMLEMMEAISKIEVTFTKTEMTMAFGDQSETVAYTVSGTTDDSVKIKTAATKKAAEGEEFTLKITKTGMEMTKEGDKMTLTFKRR
jgi:hypothetical protein